MSEVHTIVQFQNITWLNDLSSAALNDRCSCDCRISGAESKAEGLTLKGICPGCNHAYGVKFNEQVELFEFDKEVEKEEEKGQRTTDLKGKNKKKKNDRKGKKSLRLETKLDE